MSLRAPSDDTDLAALIVSIEHVLSKYDLNDRLLVSVGVLCQTITDAWGMKLAGEDHGRVASEIVAAVAEILRREEIDKVTRIRTKPTRN